MSAVEISGLNADIGFSTESDVALNEMYRSAYTVSHERKRVASRPPVVVLGRRERTQELVSLAPASAAATTAATAATAAEAGAAARCGEARRGRGREARSRRGRLE